MPTLTLPWRTFRGTRIPRRVVVQFVQPALANNISEVRAAAESWRVDADSAEARTCGGGVELVYYGDASARAFLATHFGKRATDAWDALRPGAFRADLLRYCELYVHGGVYADIKCTRLAPYPDLLGPDGTLVLDIADSGSGLWNGFFAAPPRAPWLKNAIRRVLANVEARAYGTNRLGLDITGPTVACRAVRESVALRADAQAHAKAHAQAHDDSSCEFLRHDGTKGADSDSRTNSRADADADTDTDTDADATTRAKDMLRDVRMLELVRVDARSAHCVIVDPQSPCSKQQVAGLCALVTTLNPAYRAHLKAIGSVHFGDAFVSRTVFAP